MVRAWLTVALTFVVGCGKNPGTPTSAPEKSPAEKVTPKESFVPVIGDKPTMDFPPDDWTHRELAAYLKTKGVTVEVMPEPRWTVQDKVAAYLSDGNPVSSPTVVVYLCRDHRAASDQAGSMGEGFRFGRFALGLPPERRAPVDDASLLRRVSAALK